MLLDTNMQFQDALGRKISLDQDIFKDWPVCDYLTAVLTAKLTFITGSDGEA